MVVDHVFICTGKGAPAADLLVQAGMTEGAPNQHPGQGTACRRFFFSNAMLELIWLNDEAEARSEQTRPTRLWERVSGSGPDISPFGVILRPSPGSDTSCPWQSWSYRPPTMPGLDLEIAADTSLREPMWCWMKNGKPPADWPPERRQPLDHSAGFHQITGVLIGCPAVEADSVTGAMAREGVIRLRTGESHLLELDFDGAGRGKTLDFRPALPLVLHA